MSVENNKAVVRRLFEAINAQDADALDLESHCTNRVKSPQNDAFSYQHSPSVGAFHPQ